MIEKLLPCAFCGLPPVKFVNVAGWRYGCTDMDCPGHTRPVDVYLWQKSQASFLAQRRKDFEAGVRQGVYGLPSYSQDTFLGAFDDLTCSELRDKIFNNYLRRSKGNE